MSSPAVDLLHWSDHDSELEQEIVPPPPLPVVDPDSDYEPAVVRSPPPPLPVHAQPPRGQVRGQPRGRARGRPRGQARGLLRVQAPAQPRMPPPFNRACIPYNDAWPPHKLSAYGDFVCPFCHAKHWVEEKQHASAINNPIFTLCCHAGKVCSI